MTAKDRYQQSTKAERAAVLRHGYVQQDVQEYTAVRTIDACCGSPNARTAGTFANDVLTALVNGDGFGMMT